MLFLVAIVALVVVGVLAWKTLSPQRGDIGGAGRASTRPVAPDDDPEFLRRLAERARREPDEPDL